MKFNGFSEETYQFLLSVVIHNEKSWFEENKEAYQEYVKIPMLSLEEAVRPTILSIDPRVRTGPLAVSRIYRDTRFSKDKSPLRDHAWLGYKPPKMRNSEFFSLFMSITPVGYNYGMGMYAPIPSIMQHLREKILAAPDRFLSIINDKSLTDIFTCHGTDYVRKKYQHANPEIETWLNRRGFYYIYESGKKERTFLAEFSEEVMEAMNRMKPLYQFVHDLS